MELEELLRSMFNADSEYKAPLIYPQEQREMIQSNYPILGKQTDKKNGKMSKEEAILTGLVAGLGAIAPLTRRDDNIVAPPRSTSGRGFPFKVDQLAQYPGGFKSILTRYLLGG